MNEYCAKCQGACCETLQFPIARPEHRQWLEGRAVKIGEGVAMLACRCSHLTPEGRCGIQERKPALCTDFAVGGPACRRTVRLLRPELAKEWGWDQGNAERGTRNAEQKGNELDRRTFLAATNNKGRTP